MFKKFSVTVAAAVLMVLSAAQTAQAQAQQSITQGMSLEDRKFFYQKQQELQKKIDSLTPEQKKMYEEAIKEHIDNRGGAGAIDTSPVQRERPVVQPQINRNVMSNNYSGDAPVEAPAGMDANSTRWIERYKDAETLPVDSAARATGESADATDGAALRQAEGNASSARGGGMPMRSQKSANPAPAKPKVQMIY